MQVEEDLVARSDVGQSDGRVVAATARIDSILQIGCLAVLGDYNAR